MGKSGEGSEIKPISGEYPHSCNEDRVAFTI